MIRRDAPAKINLSLSVGPLTSTGYHELETLFAALDLADEITVEAAPAGVVELSVDGDDGGVTPEENLVHRAASRFFRHATGFGIDLGPAHDGTTGGARITLTKRIPAGGGLGGGSSDAAAALLALNELYGDPLGAHQLHEIGKELGADIPFFLEPHSFAVGRGRGDVLAPVDPLPRLPVVLGLPGLNVSTAEAYRRLDFHREQNPEPFTRLDLSDGPSWDDIAGITRNDFEPVVHAWYPELKELHRAFEATHPLLCRMSGSGASHFGVYRSLGAAEEAHAVLAVAFPDVQFEYAFTGGPEGAGAHDSPA